MARTDYGAIQSTVIKDTSDSIREVNGTSALIAPSAWGTQIRTMVSGSKYQQALDNFPVITIPQTPIASFDDGAGNVPFKEVLAYIQATQSGSGDPSPINPRAISGVTQVDTTVCGVNLWDEVLERGTINNTTGELSPATTLYRSKNIISIKPNTTYYVSSNYGILVYYYDANMNYLGYVDNVGTVIKNLTTHAQAYYMRVRMFSNVSDVSTVKTSINYPATDTAYHAYTGQTATTALGGTYYGGYLNVQTGLLMVNRWFKQNTWEDGINATDMGNNTRKLFSFESRGYNVYPPHVGFPQLCNVAPYKANFLNDSVHFYCNTDECILFLPDNTPNDTIVQFSGELATPLTYQLTPAQIEQILGQNNVFCSSGDVAVKYYSIGGEIPSGNPVTILEDGVVSANASYQVATFDDISGFGIIAVSLNDGGTEHPDCVCTTVQSIIDNGGTINLPAGFNDMRVQLTLTSVTLTWYSGNWRTVTADIKGWR